LEQIVLAGLWREGEPLRLHLGCGSSRLPGFINVDFPPSGADPSDAVDVYGDLLTLAFPAGAVQEIRLSDGIQRIAVTQAIDLLSRCHAWLADEGTIRARAACLTALSNTSDRVERCLASLGFDDVRTVAPTGGDGSGEALLEGRKGRPLSAEDLLARGRALLAELGAERLSAAAASLRNETPATGVGSDDVARYVAQAYEKKRLSWLAERAGALRKGSRVLEVGFEVAAHREVFASTHYNFFDLRAFLANDATGGRGQYKVPTEDEGFDVVVCSNVFEWVLYPESALRAICRTLKKGGSLWVAPPLLTGIPEEAPARSVSGRTIGWYASTFARYGLDIRNAYSSGGFFAELAATCLDAGLSIGAAPSLPAATRTSLERLLLGELPLSFAALDAAVPTESPRASVILEAVRVRDLPDQEAELAAPRLRAQNPRPLRVTYLITSILAVTGGNMTLLNQAEELRRRGHKVTIVTYTDRPSWTRVNAEVVQVPLGEPMAIRVPSSDAVISTYCANTHELLAVEAPAKIYYAQGDQFVFGDDTPAPDPKAERERQTLKEMSRRSYGYPGVHFVANSANLAEAVFRAHGVRAEAVLPVCTDQTMFRPLRRALPGSRRRILIVGPDTRGSGAESLAFKGIADIRRALELVTERFTNFTAVRVSNSKAEIFRDFPCEYHVIPSDELKTFLFGTADILVYASHYDSCPRPPQEGMAAGCAVVCTATSGAKEYCVHEENCVLVPVRDPRAIGDAILRVITDQGLRERIVEGGKRTAARYPREREWNELEALLYTYVAAARPSATVT